MCNALFIHVMYNRGFQCVFPCLVISLHDRGCLCELPCLFMS